MPRSSSIILLFLITLALPTVSWTQETHKQGELDVGLEAMQRLSDMVGTWKGKGWIRRGPGEPHQMTSTEKVKYDLDGRILVVRGLHFAKTIDAKVVHNAFAVISYNAKSGNYRFQTYLADGKQGDYAMKIEDKSIKWFMDTPRGKITYSITIEGGVWKETGEMAIPNNPAFKFFEMELKRKQ